MSESKIIDDIMPSAAPTEDEIRRWQALPRDEQLKRLRQAIDAGFDSGVSTRSIDDIIAEARTRVGAGARG